MIDVTEIAAGIHRVALADEPDLVAAGITAPNVSNNLFVIGGAAIVQTLFRKSFARVRARAGELVDVARLAYVIVPHHEADSSGAVNDWLAAAPAAELVCSELCAQLNLRDVADRSPRVVGDGELLDLGSHRLRFLVTPQVNQWDSMMVYEEVTRTLFPNDLFSRTGTEPITRDDISAPALAAARELGYQPNDRASLERALDKIAALPVEVVAPMHGATSYGHVRELLAAFREHELNWNPASVGASNPR
jgi:flavorubredoxin